MLIENAKQMSCGNCGHQTFAVYQTEILVIECLKCESTSVLVVRTPKIEMHWGPKSDGVLCVLSSGA